MDKNTLIRNLENARDSNEYQNVMIGCIQVINQCGRSIESWMNRKPERKRIMRNIQKVGSKPRGKKVLNDLIDFTISELLVCEWIETFWIGALPIKYENSKRLTPEQKTKMQAGRRRAKQKLEAARQARFIAA